jgi:hypothetical protein
MTSKKLCLFVGFSLLFVAVFLNKPVFGKESQPNLSHFLPDLIRMLENAQGGAAADCRTIADMLRTGRYKHLRSGDSHLLGNEDAGGVLLKASESSFEIVEYGRHVGLSFAAIRALRLISFKTDCYFVDNAAYPDPGTSKAIVHEALKAANLLDLENVVSISSVYQGRPAMVIRFFGPDGVPSTEDDIYLLDGALHF